MGYEKSQIASTSTTPTSDVDVPLSEIAHVKVTRKKAFWMNRLRKFKIFIDGIEQGAVKNGKSVDIEVSPGQHTIHLTIDWMGSRQLTFTADSGELVMFECANADNSIISANEAISNTPVDLLNYTPRTTAVDETEYEYIALRQIQIYRASL